MDGCGKARLPGSWLPGITNILMCLGTFESNSEARAIWPATFISSSSLSWFGNIPIPSTRSPPKQRNFILRTMSSSVDESHSRNRANSAAMKYLLPTCMSDMSTAYDSDLLLPGRWSGMSGATILLTTWPGAPFAPLSSSSMTIWSKARKAACLFTSSEIAMTSSVPV